MGDVSVQLPLQCGPEESLGSRKGSLRDIMRKAFYERCAEGKYVPQNYSAGPLNYGTSDTTDAPTVNCSKVASDSSASSKEVRSPRGSGAGAKRNSSLIFSQINAKKKEDPLPCSILNMLPSFLFGCTKMSDVERCRSPKEISNLERDLSVITPEKIRNTASDRTTDRGYLDEYQQSAYKRIPSGCSCTSNCEILSSSSCCEKERIRREKEQDEINALFHLQFDNRSMTYEEQLAKELTARLMELAAEMPESRQGSTCNMKDSEDDARNTARMNHLKRVFSNQKTG